MNNYPNYEGYEDLGSFGSLDSLNDYRRMLMEKTRPQVDFIAKHVDVPWPMKVLEIGSGNGRLLIGLYLQGLLEYGLGLDVSESRTIFALNWRNSIGANYGALDFHDVDVLDEIRSVESGNLKFSGYDLSVCITGCFQYFYPIAPEAPKKVLNFMRQLAKYALFELYQRPPMGRTWKQLPPQDPWRYILDEYTDDGDWVTHKKIFIGGEADDDTRVEHLAYYTMPVFLKHLNKAGFENVLWAKEDSQKIVVLVK